MTSSTRSYTVYGTAQLRFTQLIAHLSHPVRFASASSIRNQLLAAYSSASQWRVGEGAEEATDEQPWDTLVRYRAGSTTICIGDVPAEIRLDAAESQAEANEHRGVWAILHVFAAPSSLPARVTLWLSSEPSFYSSSASSSPSTELEASCALLAHVLTQHLPTAVKRLASHTQAHLQQRDEKTVVLCALEHRWLDCIESNSSECGVKVDWANRCVRYYGRIDEQDAAELGEVGANANDGDGGRSVRVGRWECHALRKGAEVELARASNKIPFALGYVQARAHISVCIRDAEGDSPLTSSSSQAETPNPDSYPATRFRGAGVGWCYAHEELALAAMHVATPYRRLGASSTGEKPVSVGRLLIRTMGLLLVRAQRRALKCAGVAWIDLQGDTVDVAPIIADTEVANPAHGFFLASNLVKGRENAWVGVTLLD